VVVVQGLRTMSSGKMTTTREATAGGVGNSIYSATFTLNLLLSC
jgi:hypothetical protein